MIKIYPVISDSVKSVDIVPATKTRDWFSPHTYKCTPLTCANTLGWDLVLNESITVEWDGGVYKDNLTVIEGHGAKSHFGIGTFTLDPGYIWRTDENINLMVMPVPNTDNKDIQTMSAVIETDWLSYPWFLTIRVINKGKTTIPKGTPVARVIPVDTGTIENTKIYKMYEPDSIRKEREVLTDKRDKADEWTKDYFKKARRFVRCSPVIDYNDSFKILEENDIYSKESFLDTDDCSFLIRSWVPENPDDPSDLWRNKTCWSTIEANKGVIEERLLQFAQQKTGLDLLLLNPHTVKWGKGDEMLAHDDLGEHREFPNRHFAAIIYLNEDYEGGELVFPHLGLGIKGHTGELILFKGGSVMHRVNMITSGNRYTLVCWFAIKEGD